MKIEDVPVLPGWHSFPRAAQELGVKRQRINQLLDEGKLARSEVCQVPGSGARPAILLVSEAAVQRLRAEQVKAEEARCQAEQRRSGAQPGQAVA